METDIVKLLEEFDFPEIDLYEINSKQDIFNNNPNLDIALTLSMFGHYCMDFRIKQKTVQNNSNKNLYFISEGTGKRICMEIHNGAVPEIIQKVRRKYNNLSNGYKSDNKYGEDYELWFREMSERKNLISNYLGFIEKYLDEKSHFFVEVIGDNGKKKISFYTMVKYKNPKWNDLISHFSFESDKIDDLAMKNLEEGLIGLVAKGHKINYYNSSGQTKV